MDNDKLDLLKVVRKKIELAGQRGQKEQYHVEGEYGDHGWMHYLKGIRDACWAVDEIIKEIEDYKPTEYVPDAKGWREGAHLKDD